MSLRLDRIGGAGAARERAIRHDDFLTDAVRWLSVLPALILGAPAFSINCGSDFPLGPITTLFGQKEQKCRDGHG
jgi:hypothetical protein